MKRRTFLLALSALFPVGAPLLGACSRATEPRCSECGMKLDLKSAFLAEVRRPDGEAPLKFDAPRCALEHMVAGKHKGQLWVQEFYDRSWREAGSVRFIKGSDVIGPMGPDFIPVDGTREAKFIKDHGGRAYAFAEINTALLHGVTQGEGP